MWKGNHVMRFLVYLFVGIALTTGGAVYRKLIAPEITSLTAPSEHSERDLMRAARILVKVAVSIAVTLLVFVILMATLR